jgi:hypothetical protein
MNHPGSNSMAIDMALLVALCLWAGGGGRPAGSKKRERKIWVAKSHTMDPNRVVLKRQFASFYSLVVCEYFRQTETP